MPDPSPPLPVPETDAVDPLPEAVVAAAIHWLVKLRFNEPGVQDQRRFERWLNEQPCHRQAWQRLQMMNDPFQVVPKSLALQSLRNVDAHRKNGLHRRQVLRMLLWGGLAGTGGLTLYRSMPWQEILADIRTTVGEQRQIDLDDGTRLLLNTSTALDTRFDAGQRRIVLHCGEIYVVTGHDARSRRHGALEVATPFGTICPLGTRFSVRIDPRAARVAVYEGQVRLQPATSRNAVVTPAGTCLLLRQHEVGRAATRPFGEDDWVRGVIVSDAMRLDVLLEELSRYRRGYISCDHRVAHLSVSGIFQVTDIDAALLFLKHLLPIDVVSHTPYWVTVFPASGT